MTSLVTNINITDGTFLFSSSSSSVSLLVLELVLPHVAHHAQHLKHNNEMGQSHRVLSQLFPHLRSTVAVVP